MKVENLKEISSMEKKEFESKKEELDDLQDINTASTSFKESMLRKKSGQEFTDFEPEPTNF